VIQRCLERDPAKRPATAIQVAAALPGGDPLAAALAAGETPSPAMVAASGEKEGLRPAIAWACMVLILVGLAALAALSNRMSVVNLTPLPLAPEVLAQKARELTQTVGYGQGVDTSYGFGRYSGFVTHIDDTDKSVHRWDQLRSGGAPPVILFWYRESPQYMQNSDFTWTPGAFPEQPPARISGMVQEFFTPEGRLTEFLGVPPQLEKPEDAAVSAPAPDWGPLFAAAKLDPKNFQPTTPLWSALVASDTRAAWLGTWPGRPDLPLRLEGQAFRGKVVFFGTYFSWDTPERQRGDTRSTNDKVQGAIGLGIFLLIVGMGIVLARGNIRAGRSDWKGAARLAIFTFLLALVAMSFFAHHIPTDGELSLIIMMCGWALVGSALVWLMYVALEPHVRKRWPTSLVSWSRVWGGEILDPVVGRDVLLGVAFAVLWAVIADVGNLLPGWMGKTPSAPDSNLDFIILGGIHYTIGDILLNLTLYIFGSLALFFIFFLVRLLLRNQWLAVAAVVALFGLPALFTEHAALHAVENMLVFGTALLLLVRFGLLALLVALCVNNVLQAYPLTAHLSEWYAQPTIIVFVMVTALAVFGFYTSTAGKARLGGISLDE
jgi:hypothetical protein